MKSRSHLEFFPHVGDFVFLVDENCVGKVIEYAQRNGAGFYKVELTDGSHFSTGLARIYPADVVSPEVMKLRAFGKEIGEDLKNLRYRLQGKNDHGYSHNVNHVFNWVPCEAERVQGVIDKLTEYLEWTQSYLRKESE